MTIMSLFICSTYNCPGESKQDNKVGNEIKAPQTREELRLHIFTDAVTYRKS